MKSMEQGFRPEQEKSLSEIAHIYLNLLKDVQEGEKVYMSFGMPGNAVQIAHEEVRKMIEDIVNQVESGHLPESEARQKLWNGKATMFVTPSEK